MGNKGHYEIRWAGCGRVKHVLGWEPTLNRARHRAAELLKQPYVEQVVVIDRGNNGKVVSFSVGSDALLFDEKMKREIYA